MATIDTYTPTTLTPAEWRLVRSECLALVRARRLPEEQALQLLSTLTRFLNWAWPTDERVVSPDVRKLLIGNMVEAYNAGLLRQGETAGTVQTHLSRLRQLLAALEQRMAGHSVSRAVPPPLTDPGLRQLLAFLSYEPVEHRLPILLGIVATVVLGAGRQERRRDCWVIGRQVQWQSRTIAVSPSAARVLQDLFGSGGDRPLLTAAEEGNFRGFLAKHGWDSCQLTGMWLARLFVEPRQHFALGSWITGRQHGTKGKAVMAGLPDAAELLSLAASRDLLRGGESGWHFKDSAVADSAATDEAKPAKRGPRGFRGWKPEALKPLTPSCEKYFNEYAPKKIDPESWAEIKPILEELVRKNEPPSVASLKTLMTELPHYLVWLLKQGVVLDLVNVCDVSNVDAWAARQTQLTDISTRRSKVLRFVKKANPDLAASSHVVQARRPAKPAYTAEEIRAFRHSIALQQTPLKKKLLMLLCLGLGAGLDGRDLRGMNRDNVIDHGEDGIEVLTRGTTRQERRVWVRREWEGPLRLALAQYESGEQLLGYRTENNRNVTTGITGRFKELTGRELDPSRLRSTWLTYLLADGVPLALILAAAGIDTASVLVQLAEALPPVPESRAQQVLRGPLVELGPELSDTLVMDGLR